MDAHGQWFPWKKTPIARFFSRLDLASTNKDSSVTKVYAWEMQTLGEEWSTHTPYIDNALSSWKKTFWTGFGGNKLTYSRRHSPEPD